jgi:tRNA(Arg) A34 adenosine deaminase TadA
MYRRIIGAATNRPLYSERDSDVHAEIGAIGDAARRGHSTEGSTAYIAMPPCKNCFAALLSAGIRRIVSPRQPNKTVAAAAVAEGVEMVTVDTNVSDRIRARIDALIHAGDGDGDAEKRQAEIAAKRKARKEASKLKKEKRRRTAEENRRMHAGTNSKHTEGGTQA